MLDINFVPWRQARRRWHRNRFILMVASSLVFSILAGVALYFFLTTELDRQNARVKQIQTEIDKQDKQLTELSELRKKLDELQKKIVVVSEMQNKRNRVTMLFDLLPQVVPSGVYLQSVRLNDLNVFVTGVADSKSRLSTFLRQLEESPSTSDIQISQVQATPGGGNVLLNDFQVAFRLNLTDKLQGLPTEGSSDAAVAR